MLCVLIKASSPVEIENPFGTDANDLDGHNMQNEFNRQLLLLLNKESGSVPNVAVQEEWYNAEVFDTSKHHAATNYPWYSYGIPTGTPTEIPRDRPLTEPG